MEQLNSALNSMKCFWKTKSEFKINLICFFMLKNIAFRRSVVIVDGKDNSK